ncbi:PAAR domain-containing protein [Noviherbaspirillum sp. CPCC 100848]|uniref:PAAR domain-containing protein n=1 Tax=Noviherbaspirillum album TaxID=3080276 RepID=A0ABU6JK57_9BURK|nr:PAAR domain-containing protein [Noviherbaspirillum sp. CPCC 100848]MEC4723843.1 PAAR domain-containing protein [Noviherbaspirillum sp. CPCC 100848]
MSWLLRGLLIGAAIAVAGVAIAGTGGLAAAAIIGASAAAGAGLGELFSTMSWAPKEICGLIFGQCSSNVFTNGIRAARTNADVAHCSKHSTPHLLIATGSATVFINGLPAARVDDSTACGAVIAGGSNNVFIGGGVAQTDPVQPESLVPGWVHAALFAVGLGAAIVLGGPIVAATGTFGGLLGGEVMGRAGERVFGAGSDGQKWSMLAGSLAGGFVGVKGVPKGLDIRMRPGALGMSGGNSSFEFSTRSLRTTAMLEKYVGEHNLGHPLWTALKGRGAKVRYLADGELPKYELKILEGKLYDASGSLFDTTNSVSAHSGLGRAIYIIDEHGKIYASNFHEAGKFHHSSLSRGKPVAAAGELEVVDGELIGISDRSGHYVPARMYSDQALKIFAEKGIDMRYVFIDFIQPPLPSTPSF